MRSPLGLEISARSERGAGETGTRTLHNRLATKIDGALMMDVSGSKYSYLRCRTTPFR
jgi:hypothetical protein